MGIVILIVLVAAWGLSYLWLNQEVVGPAEVHNQEGLWPSSSDRFTRRRATW
jgi:hypothetical protein